MSFQHTGVRRDASVEVLPIVDASIPGDTKQRKNRQNSVSEPMARAPSRIRSDHPGWRQLAGGTTSGTVTEPLTTRVTDRSDPDPLRTLRPRQTIYYQTLTDVLSRYYHLSIIAAQGVLRRWVHPRWSDLQPAGPTDADPVACQGRGHPTSPICRPNAVGSTSKACCGWH